VESQAQSQAQEPLEVKIERWVKIIGRHVEEMFFYDLLEDYLKRYCEKIEILFDENPYYNTRYVEGTSRVAYGDLGYINEIVCDNTVYKLEIQYTVYEFETEDRGDVITVIHNVDHVNVEKIEEKAGE
jgi:hypothetical protein